MKKQYCLEWHNKSGRNGFRVIGYDCPTQAEKAMQKKIKLVSCASATISWNYVGDDVSDEEIGKEYFYKGLYKERLEIFGFDVYVENAYKEMVY